MEDVHTCFYCHTPFTKLSQGSLECSFHPMPFNYHSSGRNYARSKYDCCGKNRELINGCQRIDHVSGPAEMLEILLKPYVCMKKDEFTKLKLFKSINKKAIGTMKVEFINLNKSISLNNSSIVINLKEEYTKLFGLGSDELDLDTASSEIYYRDDDYDMAHMITTKETHREFFIILLVFGNKRVVHIEIIE